MKKFPRDNYYAILAIIWLIILIIGLIYAFMNNIYFDIRIILFSFFFPSIVLLMNFDFSVLKKIKGKRS